MQPPLYPVYPTNQYLSSHLSYQISSWGITVLVCASDPYFNNGPKNTKAVILIIQVCQKKPLTYKYRASLKCMLRLLLSTVAINLLFMKL